MSKFLDKLKQAEIDRVGLAAAESRIASERVGKALAEEERAVEEEAERKARARAETEARALEASQARLAAERAAQHAARARMDAVAEAGRIARERMVTELELKRAARARAEEEANAALAAHDIEARGLNEPLAPRLPPAAPRYRWLALAAALLAVLVAGIAIGRFGVAPVPRPAARAEPKPELGLKLDRDLKAFAARAAQQQKK